MNFSELENTIIGASMLERGAYTQVRHLLTADEFQDQRNRAAWEAMDKLYLKSKPIDYLTVCDQVDNLKVLTTHFANCCKIVASSANLEYYCQVLIDNLNHKEESNAHKLSAEDPSVLKTEEWREMEAARIERANKRIGRFRKADDINSQLLQTIKSIEAASKLKGLSGIPTGNDTLNEITGGFQKEYILLAARPSMGKTAKMLDYVYHACTQGKSVFIASLEMRAEALNIRLISRLSGVNSMSLKTQEAANVDMSKVQQAAATIGDWKITIDDRPRMSLDTITAAVKDHERKYGSIDVIFIDYLQIIASQYRTNRNRTDEMTEISGRIQGLVKEFDCAVVALSQLSRNVESRGDKRPIPSDLRDSGAIEQDCDLLLCLYRPSYYFTECFDDHDYKDMDNPDDYDKVLEVIIRKNRNGRLGAIKEYVDFKTGSFTGDSPSSWGALTPLENVEF